MNEEFNPHNHIWLLVYAGRKPRSVIFLKRKRFLKKSLRCKCTLLVASDIALTTTKSLHEENGIRFDYVERALVNALEPAAAPSCTWPGWNCSPKWPDEILALKHWTHPWVAWYLTFLCQVKLQLLLSVYSIFLTKKTYFQLEDNFFFGFRRSESWVWRPNWIFE